MSFLLWAEGIASAVDPTAASIVSLIGSLGSASAAVVVAWMFLGFLKSETKDREVENQRRDQRFEEMVMRQAEVIRDNSAAMREFRQSANGICRSPLLK